MINHPLTILRRTPAFAKPGLIRRNPPVQVGEGTCQVRRRQPVLIRYQIREVSGSRRTGATLLFLADPRPSPAATAAGATSPKTRLPHPFDIPLLLVAPPSPTCTAALHPARIGCHSLCNRPLRQRLRRHVSGAALAARSVAELVPAANAVTSRVSNLGGEFCRSS